MINFLSLSQQLYQKLLKHEYSLTIACEHLFEKTNQFFLWKFYQTLPKIDNTFETTNHLIFRNMYRSTNRILAFSSSRAGNGGYLETAVPIIKDFLEDKVLKIAFIPFASVRNDYDDYTSMVRNGLGGLPYLIETATPEQAVEVIEKADAIMVGGGNTFKLLHDIYSLKLLDLIRDKINKGTPYIGWSAGSNILGPTIGTTNDMPVIEPKSFNALGLLPFQINPHYANVKPAGHNGETRDQRLEEFIVLNPDLPIVGLPEGTALKLDKGLLGLLGATPAILFQAGEDGKSITRREIMPTEDISLFI